MLQSLYRAARRLARPLHPNRLRYYVQHGFNLLGLPFLWTHTKNLLRQPLRRIDRRRRASEKLFLQEMASVQAARKGEERLTVAVDITPFWERLTGIGWYLYRLLEHLAERDDLRLRLYGPSLIDTPDAPRPVIEIPSGPAIEVIRYAVPEDKDLATPQNLLVEHLRSRQAEFIAADGNTVLFAPNYFLPDSFASCDGRLAATVHDLSVLRVPHTLRESTRLDLEKNLRATIERCAAVVTDSETVRGELIESGLVTAERVHAVHLAPASAIDPAAVDPSRRPEGTPERYALHVGTLEPRKNLPVAFAAWRLLRERGVDPPPLLLCGGFGWKTDALRAEIEAGEKEGLFHHFGYLDDDAVAALYAGAHLAVLPSIYEGFGLPAAEAMRFGAPLIMSDIPVLREVGDDAALYAAPDDPEAWAARIEEVLRDEALRKDLIVRGHRRSEDFHWSKTAEGTARIFHTVAETTVAETTVAGRA